ncbi:DUF4232 domain-containing protein [Streptomyces sp. NPDC059740]|uniref:DUF4232 domain-containing protein n=1 Tax=Streptomyces sp. NPDC059740 TaxID=3346926 RepID=UPI00364B0D8B
MNTRRVTRLAAALAASAALALTATACDASESSAKGSASSSAEDAGSQSASTGKGSAHTDAAGSGSARVDAAAGKGTGAAVTSPSPKAAAPAASKTACTGAELKPSIVHGTDADPDPEASQTTATLLFTNVGKRTCTVQGHPGVDLVTASGDTWSLMWQKKTAEKVTLRPGVATMAELTFLPVSPSSKAPDQQPFLPTGLKVTPPDTTATATLTWPWQDIAVLRQDGATHPGTYISTVEGTASS